MKTSRGFEKLAEIPLPSTRYIRRQAVLATREVERDLGEMPIHRKAVLRCIIRDFIARGVHWGKRHPNEP